MSRFKKSWNEAYVGISTEEKPTQGIEEWSLFKELDTGDMYFLHNGVWSKANESSPSDAGDEDHQDGDDENHHGGDVLQFNVTDEEDKLTLDVSYNDIKSAIEGGIIIQGIWENENGVQFLSPGALYITEENDNTSYCFEAVLNMAGTSSLFSADSADAELAVASAVESIDGVPTE